VDESPPPMQYSQTFQVRRVTSQIIHELIFASSFPVDSLYPTPTVSAKGSLY
jgi:hypothetical protein